MRWERLFAELEGHAEHAHAIERDELVAELREGEWAERSWLDSLQHADGEVEIAVLDLGVLVGSVRLANAQVVHIAGRGIDHFVATDAVQWVRGAPKAGHLVPDSVIARLGWGHVLREAADDADHVHLILADGRQIVQGSIVAVGRDFVRIAAGISEKDVPMSAIRMATVSEGA